MTETPSIEPKGVELVYVRDRPGRRSLRQWGMSLVAGAAVVLLFDWDPGKMAFGAVVGVLVWGTFHLFSEVLPQVPGGGLPSPPARSRIASSGRGALSVTGYVVFAVVACFALAWLADLLTVGAAFVPGQFAGYACSSALGTALVFRWERSNGARVVADRSDHEEDGPMLYALPRRADGGIGDE